MRLFVALDLPDDIKTAVTALCTGLPGVRWITRDQMHLTLRFIGEVDEAQGEAIKTALGQIAFTPFEVSVRGVGRFPSKGTPRVLWVGLETPPTLPQLAHDIEAAVTALSLPPADKPFSAHITLARLKSPPPPEAVREFFARNRDFATEPFTVSEFVLYSSTLTPRGSIYQREAVYS